MCFPLLYTPTSSTRSRFLLKTIYLLQNNQKHSGTCGVVCLSTCGHLAQEATQQSLGVNSSPTLSRSLDFELCMELSDMSEIVYLGKVRGNVQTFLSDEICSNFRFFLSCQSLELIKTLLQMLVAVGFTQYFRDRRGPKISNLILFTDEY